MVTEKRSSEEEGLKQELRWVWLIKQQFNKHLLSTYYVPTTVQGEVMGLT